MTSGWGLMKIEDVTEMTGGVFWVNMLGNPFGWDGDEARFWGNGVLL